MLRAVEPLEPGKHTRQRFEAQQALYAEAFFRRAMENSVLIGMRVLDMHGRITHVNPAFCRMTGWDETDLVGKVAPFRTGRATRTRKCSASST